MANLCYETQLECTCCGNKARIQRRKTKKRKKGHIKHLYCFKCKDKTAHEEVIDGLPEWLKENA